MPLFQGKHKFQTKILSSSPQLGDSEPAARLMPLPAPSQHPLLERFRASLRAPSSTSISFGAILPTLTADALSLSVLAGAV